MQQNMPSTFAQMVDMLKNKSEEELKLLYLNFFGNNLIDGWKEITKDVDLRKPLKKILCRQ